MTDDTEFNQANDTPLGAAWSNRGMGMKIANNISQPLQTDTTCPKCGKSILKGHVVRFDLDQTFNNRWRHTDCDDPTGELLADELDED